MERPEQALHQAVASLLTAILLPHRVLWLHVPNGGRRSGVEAAILKSMGVRAGVPDLLIMWSDIRHHCRVAWIELKVDDRKPSQAQLGFHAAVRTLGHHVGVARSIEEVLTMLADFGVPHRRATTSGVSLPVNR